MVQRSALVDICLTRPLGNWSDGESLFQRYTVVMMFFFWCLFDYKANKYSYRHTTTYHHMPPHATAYHHILPYYHTTIPPYYHTTHTTHTTIPTLDNPPMHTSALCQYILSYHVENENQHVRHFNRRISKNTGSYAI